MLSMPSASSPRPWMKIKAADLAMSAGGSEGGIIMGGILSGAIVQAVLRAGIPMTTTSPVVDT